MDLPATMWRKSSYSGTESDCVEVAITENVEAIRDSKNPTGGVLTVRVSTFVSMLRQGLIDC